MASVSDQEIHNDDIVYMVFAKETGGGWEELQVDVFAAFHPEEATAAASTLTSGART